MEASAERPVVAQKALPDSLKAPPFVNGDGSHSWVVLLKGPVPSFYLSHDESAAVNRDDVGLKPAAVPVSLDVYKAASREVRGGDSLAPGACLKARRYTATRGGDARSEFSEGPEMPTTPAKVLR